MRDRWRLGQLGRRHLLAGALAGFIALTVVTVISSGSPPRAGLPTARSPKARSGRRSGQRHAAGALANEPPRQPPSNREGSKRAQVAERHFRREARRHRRSHYSWRGRTASPEEPAGRIAWVRHHTPVSNHVRGKGASISSREGSAGAPPADQLDGAVSIINGPGNSLYVADNNNARYLQITDTSSKAILGDGISGYKDGPAKPPALTRPSTSSP